MGVLLVQRGEKTLSCRDAIDQLRAKRSYRRPAGAVASLNFVCDLEEA